jgi:hypothetical protein
VVEPLGQAVEHLLARLPAHLPSAQLLVAGQAFSAASSMTNTKNLKGETNT